MTIIGVSSFLYEKWCCALFDQTFYTKTLLCLNSFVLKNEYKLDQYWKVKSLIYFGEWGPLLRVIVFENKPTQRTQKNNFLIDMGELLVEIAVAWLNK